MSTNSLRLATRPGPSSVSRGAVIGERIRDLDPALQLEQVVIPSDPAFDASSRPEHDPELATWLREALLRGEAEILVHAVKDLPHGTLPGVRLAAVPERGEVRECLLARGAAKLAALPPGARVAVDTDAREAALRALRGDLGVVRLQGPLRGRAARLEAGECDGILTALIAARRLGLHALVGETFGFDAVLPSAGQGAAAVEIHEGEEDLLRLLNRLDQPASRWCVVAEREAEAAALAAGALPVGAYAEVRDMNVHLRVRLLAGGALLRGADIRPVHALEGMGRELVERLLSAP